MISKDTGELLCHIAEQAVIMIAAREKADRILEYNKRLLIGRKYEPFKSGVLAGAYQITDVEIDAFYGTVIGHGRKITARGLGSKCWHLGNIHMSRLS